ncbi:hypothetical protein ACG9X6_22590 [Acinetobacter guillouiae]|uniref:hypothetical protein n=1 Tax=Acinetobacter guillouiae TaxID=106649 RepID=UPI003AF83CF7
MNRYIFLIPILISLSACYPYIEKTIPEIEVTVKDSEGKLVDLAYVVLTTTVKEGKTIKNYKTQYTKNGKAYFDVNRSFALNMGLERKYTWSLCVSKQGYKKQYYSISDKSIFDIHLESLKDPKVNQKCQNNTLIIR